MKVFDRFICPILKRPKGSFSPRFYIHTEVAVESFKNGIEVGKARKGRVAGQSGKEEADEAVTSQPEDVELSA